MNIEFVFFSNSRKLLLMKRTNLESSRSQFFWLQLAMYSIFSSERWDDDDDDETSPGSQFP